jgi:SAM-dependent methyltransferase
VKESTRSRIASGLDRARLLAPAEQLRDRWLARRAGPGPAVGPDGLPLPPPRLRQLVSGRSADAEYFVRIGEAMASSIRAAAADAGSPVEEMRAILDFGCGSGRVARNWAGLQGPEIHGCDYNEELVRWCAANLPFLRVARNELEPPAPYEAESFDLVYALSVLSHLGEPLQERWVAEYRRLLRPGGLLVVSVLGEKATHRLAAEERERFDRGELVVERPRMEGRNSCTAYHPANYVTGSLLAGFSGMTAFELGSAELPVMQGAYLARR